MLSPGSIVIIGAIALVVFGPKKLPEIGKAAGKTLREFKNATNGILDDDVAIEKHTKQSESKDEHNREVILQTEETSSQNKNFENPQNETSNK